jgi:di/tricarboxylate transporter
LDHSQILFLVITLVAIVLFISELLRVDLIALLVILALTLTGLLDVKLAFSGFSSEPALIVAAVFVLSAGLFMTGVTDVIGEWVGRLAGKTETQANLVIMTAVAGLSAFTHHLMVTAMMLPIVLKISADKKIPASRLLIPMATSASLGTTLTLIGAPAFLLANNILVRAKEPSLGLFSISQVGLPLILCSFVFIILVKWVLPKNTGKDDADDRFKLTSLVTELVIPEGSQWIGKKFGDLKDANGQRFETLTWYRRGRLRMELDVDGMIREGDVFLVKTTSDELLSIEEKQGLALRAVKKYGESIAEDQTSLFDQKSRILQAVIAPHSPFIGRTIANVNFLERYGVVAVGIWRKSGWISQEVSQIQLREGDLLVLWGPEDRFESLSKHRGFLMLLPLQAQPKNRIKARTAVVVMGASILAAATGLIVPHVAFTLGAVAMILTRCLSPEEAYESIETKIYVMIAGVIPLGIAMEKTGVDRLLAEQLLVYTQQLSPFAILLIFFWAAALLTQILSDAATTVLLAPIALAFAHGANISPTAAVVTVTTGAVASFLTPIGHHGNLLILSPGGYRFADFLKIGLPLTIIISVVTCYMSLRTW